MRDPMIDGSDDHLVFTPDGGTSWINSRSRLDTSNSFAPPGMTDSTYRETGFTGVGSNMTLPDVNNGISPVDLSLQIGVTPGRLDQFNHQIGSQGHRL